MQDELNRPARTLVGAEIGGVPLAAIADCNGLRLRKASRRMTAIYDAQMRDVGLTSQQFALMTTIHGPGLAGKAVSMGLLSELTGLDPTTLTRTLAPLRSAGWVTSGQAREDRRRKEIELTPAGRVKLAEGAARWQAASAIVQDQLGPDLMDQVRQTLDMALARLERPAAP